MKHRPASAVLVMALAGAGTAGAQPRPTFHGSEAFRDFRTNGHEMRDERMTDLDNDGLLDAVVVEQSEAGVALSAWRATRKGDYRRIFRGAPASGETVAAFERIPLGSSDMAFLLHVLEDSPDEADHDVKLFLENGEGLQPVFHTTYRTRHSEQEAGRRPVRVVDLGGLDAGFGLVPAGGGWPRAVVRHEPKRIDAIGRGGESVRFVIGIRERVWRADGRRYGQPVERYLNYLPRHGPAAVTATSALSGEDGGEASGAADGRLDSGWVENDAGPGTGQAVTLSYPQPVSIRVIRVVPGCAATAAGWEGHNRLKSFTLEFEGGVRVRVVRGLGAELDPRVAAADDFALPGRAHGTQTLVFLYQPVETSWIKLVIGEVEPGGNGEDRTCVGEITAHAALADVASAP